MVLAMAILVLILILGFFSSVEAATYYIDFAAGTDTNNGTTSSTPWKTFPGVMSNCNTSTPTWQQTSWGGGTFSSTNKVPAGTTFKLKPGTTYNSTVGQCIWLNPVYYNEGSLASPIRFELDTAQGAGVVTFDGSGIAVTIALILSQIDGIQFDGKIAQGITVSNSTMMGFHVKEKAGAGAAVLDCSFRYMKFFNNGTSFLTDFAGSGAGQLSVRKAIGCTIDNIELDGDNNFINGVLLGDGHMTVTNTTVSNSVAYNHQGDIVDNDAGIGFKALNGQVTFTDDISYSNLKGFDLGAVQPDGADLTYTVINALAYANYWGMNFNNGDNSSANVNFYVINSIIRDNTLMGMLVYAGPYNLYVVHNVVSNNGSASTFNDVNIAIGPGECNDQTLIQAYLYNNVFWKPNSTWRNLMIEYVGDATTGHDTNLNMYGDYNAWVQKASESFADLAAYSCTGRATGITYTYTYGGNGPGHLSGLWYTTEDDPGNGIGHLNNDGHSKGTGATDTTLPPFTNAAGNDFTLTATYPGTTLTSQPWYIAAMGVDRAGHTRTSWDIGAYEFVATGPVPTVLRLGRTPSVP